MNWFTIAGLVFQETEAVEQDIAEVNAGQPVASPAFDITLPGGKKYQFVLNGTPVA